MPSNIPTIINNITQPAISYWINGGMLITSICMVIITITNIIQNKNLWKYEIFFKEEAKILLKFRKAYTNNYESINWFFINLLLVKQKSTSTSDIELPIIERKDIIKHYNKINAIYSFYRKNQYAFGNHRIDEDVNLLYLFLEVVENLPKKDLKYEMISKDDKEKTYILEHAYKIIYLFNHWCTSFLTKYKKESRLKKVFFPKRKQTEEEIIKAWDEEMKNFFQKNHEEEFEKMKQEIQKRLEALYFKINNMCIFPQKIPIGYIYCGYTKEFPYLKE